MTEQIERNVNVDKVTAILNILNAQLGEIVHNPEFPSTFTDAEFAVASVLMARHLQGRMNKIDVPLEVYMDELTQSYQQFVHNFYKPQTETGNN